MCALRDCGRFGHGEPLNKVALRLEAIGRDTSAAATVTDVKVQPHMILFDMRSVALNWSDIGFPCFRVR